jgi:hypothetical protein
MQTLVLVWPGHESWENSHANSRFSTLINSHATLVLVWQGHESWENPDANSRFSTLMQLLFSFDRGMRVEKTLMQTLASQLSSTLINSCSHLTGAWELRKLSCKLSLLNNSHLPFTRVKISQFVSKMCSHCLFPVVDMSETSYCHLVTKLTRPTDSQQVSPTSLISSARNKLFTSWWQQARSNLLRTACISLVGTTCSKSVTVINLVTRW